MSQNVAKALGSQVVLSSPVRRIEQDGKGVVVTGDRVVVSAKQVIVAIPPVLVGAIDFAPALPRDAAQPRQADRARQPDQVGGDLRHARSGALRASAARRCPTSGPANTTFDNSPPDGTPGVVFGFIGGTPATQASKLSVGRQAQGRCSTTS